MKDDKPFTLGWNLNPQDVCNQLRYQLWLVTLNICKIYPSIILHILNAAIMSTVALLLLRNGQFVLSEMKHISLFGIINILIPKYTNVW